MSDAGAMKSSICGTKRWWWGYQFSCACVESTTDCRQTTVRTRSPTCLALSQRWPKTDDPNFPNSQLDTGIHGHRPRESNKFRNQVYPYFRAIKMTCLAPTLLWVDAEQFVRKTVKGTRDPNLSPGAVCFCAMQVWWLCITTNLIMIW